MATFIDEAKVNLRAGRGGRGCVSFRREKFVPKGGPDGGDGGKGGDIVITADGRLATLLDYKYKREYAAEHGRHGMGGNRSGRDGQNLHLRVPVGTIIKDASTGRIVADMVKDGQEVILLKGGRGGKGNAFFKSATNQAPRYAQSGEEGATGEYLFELKLLADVGIIGFPNAGKSTLISRVSQARPRVANYPFTTLSPHLGVVRFKEHHSFVIADIPGLIVGAHSGKGLGIKFLKHIERTILLVHVLDLMPQREREPAKDYDDINRELCYFNPELSKRSQVVALNKIDIPEAKKRLSPLLQYFKARGVKAFGISAVTGEGIDTLMDYVGTLVVKKREGSIEDL